MTLSGLATLRLRGSEAIKIAEIKKINNLSTILSGTSSPLGVFFIAFRLISLTLPSLPWWEGFLFLKWAMLG